jgi:hypothetical protein
LLYPLTNEANVFTVDTSRKYAVALLEEVQFAVMDVHPAFDPAIATGAARIDGFTVTVRVATELEHPPVPATV